jgi:hypothetical protein
MTGVRAGEAPRLEVNHQGARAGARADDGAPARGTPVDGARPRDVVSGPQIHRLGDLSRPARWWALAVALAVVAAPIAALAHFVPDWSASNDPALMGLRALDVGTANTPTLGQPSQTRLYTDGVASVHHPGPLHFYLLAVPVRLLGPWGMPAVSVLVTGTCLLLSLWIVHRLLGVRAALVATVALALVAFTTGASSFVNPVSSSIAGYPLLLSVMAVWAVASGDVRLLPLATAVVTFTAQQHLSVLPATAVVCAGSVVVGGLGWRRAGPPRDDASRRDLRRSAGLSAAVALVLWLPVLAQQAFGNTGNLGEMLWFARHGNGDSLGYGRRVQQVAHALGLPPLLGRTDLDGTLMLSSPSILTWMSAGAALGVVGLITWRHRDDPARLALGAMTGVAVVEGLVGGASVPAGPEQARLAFYHWAFAVALLVALVIGTAAADALAAGTTRRPLGRLALVNDDRLSDADELDGGLVLVASGVERPSDVPEGAPISRVQVAEPFPFDALARLRAAAADAGEVVYDRGPVGRIDEPDRRELSELVLDGIADEPDHALLNAEVLDLVVESSFESPAFDPDDLRTVRDALERLDTDGVSGRVTEVRLYHLTLDEMLAYTTGVETGPR